MAQDAYTGYPFKVNVAYACAFASSWFILSAKYGLLRPDDQISGPYDVSFNRRTSNPIGPDVIRDQIPAFRLDACPAIVALGGRAYREILQAALEPFDIAIYAPFAGLSLGKSVRAVRDAIELGDPFLKASQ